MKKNQGFALIILILIVIGILTIVGIVFYWQRMNILPTASSWKTYQNDNYGYGIRYPGNWKLNTESEPLIYDSKKFSYTKCVNFESSDVLKDCSYVVKITATAGSVPTVENFKKMINRFATNNQTMLTGETNIVFKPVANQEIKKDSMYKIKYIETAESGNIWESVWILGKERLFNITFYYYGEENYENVFDQIISTFKFIE